MNFKIVNIEKKHKEKIFNLIEEINKKDKLNYSLTEEWLDYVIENAGQGIFLGFHGNQLAGMGTAMINSAYKDQGTLNVVVDPLYRNMGLGAILYDHIYDYAKEKNIRIVESYVKERLDHGLYFAEKKDFSPSMYSWEMDLDLNDLAWKFEEKENLKLRKASKKDGYIYKEIIYDAFKDKIKEDSLGQALEDPSNLVYILEKENKALGSASVQLREESSAYMYDIAILSKHRGQGLGLHLIKACLMDLKAKDIDRVSLLVTGENIGALGLYRKIGFREVDRDIIMLKEVDK